MSTGPSYSTPSTAYSTPSDGFDIAWLDAYYDENPSEAFLMPAVSSGQPAPDHVPQLVVNTPATPSGQLALDQTAGQHVREQNAQKTNYEFSSSADLPAQIETIRTGLGRWSYSINGFLVVLEARIKQIAQAVGAPEVVAALEADAGPEGIHPALPSTQVEVKVEGQKPVN